MPDQIGVLYNLIDELWNVNWKLNEYRAPLELSVVEVTTAKHVLKPMVVLRVDSQRCLCLYIQKDDSEEGLPLSYDEVSTTYEGARAKARVNRITVDGRGYVYEYNEVNWDMISAFYKNTIANLEKRNLHFV